MSVTSAAVLLHKMREGAKLIQNPYGRFALTVRSGTMFEVTYRAASTLLRHKQIRYTERRDNRGARTLELVCSNCEHRRGYHKLYRRGLWSCSRWIDGEGCVCTQWSPR